MKLIEIKNRIPFFSVVTVSLLLTALTSSCIKPPEMPRNPGPVIPATKPVTKEVVPPQEKTVTKKPARTTAKSGSPAKNHEKLVPLEDSQTETPAKTKLLNPTGKTDVEMEIRRITRAFGYKGNEAIPPSFVKRVNFYIDYFSNNPNGRSFFCSAMNRGRKYSNIISVDLAQKHLPMELGYLPLVESGYNPKASSHAGAVGMWQFMKGTARRYGLKVTRYRDDRRNPIRSTRAAAEYLDDLLAMFGVEDPFLGISAYNAGEGRVLAALRKTSFRERSFWVIAKKGILANETRNYIPKWLAASILAQNPGRYGLSCGGNMTPLVMNASVSEGPTLVKKAESPRASQPFVPAKTAVVSVSTADPAPAAVISEKKEQKPVKRTVKNHRGSPFVTVKVQKGDTLFKIATAFGKTVNQLKKWNHLRTSHLRLGQNLRVYEMDAGTKLVWVNVHPGDTLAGIAKKNRVTVTMLKNLNHVSQASLIAGSTLRLYTTPKVQKSVKTTRHTTSKPKKQQPVFKHKGYKVTYTVQYKGNLALIALAYDLDIRDIMRWNHLRHSRIYPKQKLTLYLKKAPKKVIVHTVKKGETAGKIARKYKVSLYDNILALNGLVYDSVLSPGKKLKVYVF